MISRLILRIIDWYQVRGGGQRFFAVECNFEPSCSEYTKQAVETYGAIKGVPMSVARLKRCNQPDLVHKIDDPLPLPEETPSPSPENIEHV